MQLLLRRLPSAGVLQKTRLPLSRNVAPLSNVTRARTLVENSFSAHADQEFPLVVFVISIGSSINA